MHGDIFAEHIIATFQGNQHTDLAAMYISTNGAISGQQLSTANLNVLTDFLYQRLTGHFHSRAFGGRQRGKLGGIGFAGSQHRVQHPVAIAQVVMKGHRHPVAQPHRRKRCGQIGQPLLRRPGRAAFGDHRQSGTGGFFGKGRDRAIARHVLR